MSFPTICIPLVLHLLVVNELLLKLNLFQLETNFKLLEAVTLHVNWSKSKRGDNKFEDHRQMINL